MNAATSRFLGVLLAAAIAGGGSGAGCFGRSPPQVRHELAVVPLAGSLSPLVARFDAGAGERRFIALLSPT